MDFNKKIIPLLVAILLVAPLAITNAYILLPVASRVGFLEIVKPLPVLGFRSGVHKICIYSDMEAELTDFRIPDLKLVAENGNVVFFDSYVEMNVTHGQEVGSRRQVSAVEVGVLTVGDGQTVVASLETGSRTGVKLGSFVTMWKIPVVTASVIFISIVESLLLAFMIKRMVIKKIAQ